jgi:hypothetical protein
MKIWNFITGEFTDMEVSDEFMAYQWENFKEVEDNGS